MSGKLEESINKFNLLNNLEKLEVCTIIFEEWNQGLIKDNKYIFLPRQVGLREGLVGTIAIVFYSLYCNLSRKKIIYPINLLEISLSKESKKVIEIYRKLSFINKLDFLENIIRRYGKKELFKMLPEFPPFSNDKTEEEIANEIKKYKNKIMKG